MSVFFFKQKTAYEMRISDWSSDVCSSDLSTTSSTGLLANELSPMAVPRAAAARATATSPSGWTACTPVGEIITGMEIGWPITLVASSRGGGLLATSGARPGWANGVVRTGEDRVGKESARTGRYMW